MSTMGDQRPEVFVMPVAATQFFQFEIFLRQSRLPKPQEDQLVNAHWPAQGGVRIKTGDLWLMSHLEALRYLSACKTNLNSLGRVSLRR